MRQVLAALATGVTSRAELTRATGLDDDLVDGVLDHLVRTGLLEAQQLGGGCPDNGCGGCPSSRTDGSAGCGSASPATSRGPVALTLRRREELG